MIEVQSVLKDLDGCLHGHVVPSDIVAIAANGPGGNGSLSFRGLDELLTELKTWLDILLVPLENEIEVLAQDGAP
jgi:hypothetical protein